MIYRFSDGYELHYAEQVENRNYTKLAEFALYKNNKLVESFTTNYKPSRTFPLHGKILEVAEMLIHEDAWKGFFAKVTVPYA